MPLGYIEAKDLTVSLRDVAESDQLKRYRRSLNNLILTNYLDFHWYVGGELREEATLGRVVGNDVRRDPEGETAVADLLNRFLMQEMRVVYTAEALAQRMAQLARMMDRAITATFEQEKESGPFHAQYRAFQNALIPSLTEAEFADMYAQTLTYGLFAARVRQLDSGGELTRYNIHQYLPSTNPFLTDFFYQISGPNMPDAVSWLVDDLAHLLRRADMPEILRQFGQRTRQEDPIIHFYETFLREYDPKLRQNRGVYYTPEPVVSYIVRSLDHILQTHFDRPLGLADPNTLILDPATGTGTFLYFTIQHIYEKLQEVGQAGSWNSYVKTSLLPRLFGFELLMAPYAVAHLKLGIQLRELGYQFDSDERLNIFLTNALSEPQPPVEQMGFAQFISKEGVQASEVKLGKPIMVVMGNPPYSVSSANNNDYIMKLMDSYKKAVRSERNIQPLNDDYIKFIRFAHDRIERTGHGVVAMITNHAYLSGLIHRGMREELLKSFSHIYILDLHGNALTGDVSKGDENVFDIRQGVAIAFFVKEAQNTASTKIFFSDLWGNRTDKYKNLLESESNFDHFEPIHAIKPSYYFIPFNTDLKGEYDKSPSTQRDVFIEGKGGIQTGHDNFSVSFDKISLNSRLKVFFDQSQTDSKISKTFGLKSKAGWNLTNERKQGFIEGIDEDKYRLYFYRIFDNRWIYFSKRTLKRPVEDIMSHLLEPNISLVLCRQQVSVGFRHLFVTTNIGDGNAISIKSREWNTYFPLYVYTTPESTVGTLFATTETTREPNLAPSFIRTVEQTLGLTFYRARAV